MGFCLTAHKVQGAIRVPQRDVVPGRDVSAVLLQKHGFP